MNVRDIIDHHTHTCHSPDALENATFAAYLEAATARGVPGLMFTDHVDMDTPVALFQTFPDYTAYAKMLATWAKKTNFDLRMGVEVGLQPHLTVQLETFLAHHPFDVVIGSIHLGDGLDFYNGDFFQGKTQQEAYRRYFEIVRDVIVSMDTFDIFGHFDYIIRYGGYADKHFETADYDDLILPALGTLAKRGKALEINTSGFRYGLGVTHPKLDILRRFKSLGGTYVTLGSDAHDVADLQAHFPEALAMLKQAGFTAVTTYKHRIPTLHPLD